MSENRCGKKGTYRYTWPGNDESFACQEHAQKVRGIADAMGFPIQLIPLHESELENETCRQIVKQ